MLAKCISSSRSFADKYSSECCFPVCFLFLMSMQSPVTKIESTEIVCSPQHSYTLFRTLFNHRTFTTMSPRFSSHPLSSAVSHSHTILSSLSLRGSSSANQNHVQSAPPTPPQYTAT